MVLFSDLYGVTLQRACTAHTTYQVSVNTTTIPQPLTMELVTDGAGVGVLEPKSGSSSSISSISQLFSTAGDAAGVYDGWNEQRHPLRVQEWQRVPGAT